MNFYMVRVAISSFSGVETESAYKAGLSFKNDIAAAHAQDARHWSVEASLQRGDDAGIIVTARDAQGAGSVGLTAEYGWPIPRTSGATCRSNSSS